MNRQTIEQLQKRLDVDNPYSTKILSNDDIHHTKYKCGRCGCVSSTPFHSLLRNKYKTCKSCAKQLKSTRLLDIDCVRKEIYDNNLIPLFDDYHGSHMNLLVSDNDGYVGEMSLVTIRNGAKISKFAKYNKYALENLRLYFDNIGVDCIVPEQEYFGWDSPIDIICSCGKKYKATVTHIICDKQYQCVDCSKSKSNNEKIVENWLKNNSIEYEWQKKFDWCAYKKLLPFDFYLPKYNTYIEIDGEGHYKPTRFNGIDKERANELFEKTKIRDSIKTECCENNNIRLVRISYLNIKNKEYERILSSIIR